MLIHSSVSSALNAAAANTYDDILRPYWSSIKPHRATVISKGLGRSLLLLSPMTQTCGECYHVYVYSLRYMYTRIDADVNGFFYKILLT